MDEIKMEVFEHNSGTSDAQHTDKTSCKLTILSLQCEKWKQIIDKMPDYKHTLPTAEVCKTWCMVSKCAKGQIKNVIRTIQHVRQQEWINSKNYLINIGKFGSIAHMIDPKNRSGPTASKIFPSKPNEPVRYAINDTDRKEASLITHEIWMNDPPGSKNCHFIDTTIDEVGINAINIDPEKTFDNAAEWQYLESMLTEKTNEQIAERVRLACKRLPKLFRQIHTEATLTYPFKYDCKNGKFLYTDLEKNLRQNVTGGNVKARATGFAIPVLGRLPKIFLDTYLIKCKLQMTLRMLDTGTECSLRICIGKQCGGVWPLTVGHDDNVFLNGIAQQAIQKEIAKHRVLPENVFSCQKGKGCSDATIIDCIVKKMLCKTMITMWQISVMMPRKCLIGFTLKSKSLNLCWQVLESKALLNGNVPTWWAE